MDQTMSDLRFQGMSLLFGVRDFLRPRGPILQEAGIRPGDQVLDFGCGPGSYTLPAAQLVGDAGKIYALDLQPLALERVAQTAQQRGLENVYTIRSHGPTALPAGTLDVVLLYDVFHLFSQPQTILAELRRVLKPGGRLSVNDHHLQDADIVAGITRSAEFVLAHKGRYTLTFAPVLRSTL